MPAASDEIAAAGAIVNDAGAVVPERVNVAQLAVPLQVTVPNAMPDSVAPPPLETVTDVDDGGGAPAKVASDTAADDNAIVGPGPTESLTATVFASTEGRDEETVTVAWYVPSPNVPADARNVSVEGCAVEERDAASHPVASPLA